MWWLADALFCPCLLARLYFCQLDLCGPKVCCASHEMQCYVAYLDCQSNTCNAGSTWEGMAGLPKDFGTKFDSASMQRDIARVKYNDRVTKLFKCICNQCVDKGHGVFKSWPLYPAICTAVGVGDSKSVCAGGCTDCNFPLVCFLLECVAAACVVGANRINVLAF